MLAPGSSQGREDGKEQPHRPGKPRSAYLGLRVLGLLSNKVVRSKSSLTLVRLRSLNACIRKVVAN